MAHDVLNVLFLCTGNSARSIFAECLVNRLGGGRFRGFSAGSHPKGEVNPFTLYELSRNNHSLEGLRSKDWTELAAPGAPHMDFVFTVCDKAHAEVCPLWPGQPMTAHWGIADPVSVEGADMLKKAAFHRAYAELEKRIAIFVSLPFASLDRLRLQRRLDEIGRIALAESPEPVSSNHSPIPIEENRSP